MAYRKANELKRTKDSPQLLVDGVVKEVYTDDMDHPVVAEVYTVPESAKAIGKTTITIKRWISDNLIPAPVLIDCINGYRHYSRGELSIIAELLHKYSKDYSYIVSVDSPFVHSVQQRLEHYRRTSI